MRKFAFCTIFIIVTSLSAFAENLLAPGETKSDNSHVTAVGTIIWNPTSNIVTVPNNSWTSFPLNSVYMDYGGLAIADGSNYKIKIAHRGVYTIYGYVQFGSPGGQCGVRVIQNGRHVYDKIVNTVGGGFPTIVDFSYTDRLSENDIFIIEGFQNSGSTVSVSFPQIGIVKIGELY